MLQRPGCFIWVVVALFVGTAIAQNYLKGITDAQPVVAQPQTTREVWIAASVTPVASVTVDALATLGAASAATADVVYTQQAGTQTQAIIGTSAARTATADTWTATAAADAATLVAAEKTVTDLRVAILVGTLTAIPPMQTEVQAQQWATAHAESTRAAVAVTLDAREATQAAVVDEALYWATLALIGGGAVIILAGLGWVVVALSWRVQGKAGGEAQATVEQAKRRDPIPTTAGGQPTAPLDPYTKAEHLAMRALGRMAAPDKGGPDATMLTSAPVFSDNKTRDKVRDALIAAGLARSENGVGVELLGGWTVGSLAQAIADGEVTLDDPPTLSA
jgi:hypothetical protein